MDWIRYRIEDARTSRAPRLDLGCRRGGEADRLTELPSDILDMTWLEELDLGGHAFLRLPRDIGRLQRLRRLGLWGNRDIRLDDGLGDLAELRALDIGDTSAATVAGLPWRHLHKVQRLNLSDCHLDQLPRKIADLDDLVELEARGNRCATPPLLPAGLAHLALDWPSEQSLGWLPSPLKALRLTIKGGSAIDLPPLPELGHLTLWRFDGAKTDFRWPSWLDGQPFLHTLDLSGRGLRLRGVAPIATLPALTRIDLYGVSGELGDLAPLLQRPLTHISLKDIGLGPVPPELWRNHRLESLSLQGAGLTELPPAWDGLPNLRHLDLSGNAGLRELPPGLAALPQLESLAVVACGLTALPAELGQSRTLKRIFLSGNAGLTTIPAALLTIPTLEHLGLARTAITTLPPGIAGLEQLRFLDLSGTQVRDLPLGLTRLRRLGFVGLRGCPIANLPPEIVQRGWAAIQRYAAGLEDPQSGGETRLFEAKMLLVGEGAVGKTSLQRKLLDPACDVEARQAEIVSTEGIEVAPWPVSTGKSRDFRINVWDFGGQEIYHATHQFFLTKRSLYLLVWEARRDDRAGSFEYWLHTITLLSGGSPILVVMNKSDERTKTNLPEDELRRRFPNIVGFLQVSAWKGTNIDTLRHEVCRTIDALPHVGTLWPAAWSRVRQRLEEDPRDYVPVEEFHAICRQERLPEDGDEVLSGFLHDLGVILHFRDDPQLRHTVILKPAWGTDAVYTILDTEFVKQRHGRFRLDELPRIWDRKRYPAAKHADLVRLMERFELCFRMEGADTYIVPELLSANRPAFAWDDGRALVFDYRYDEFMPAGIITRFICRTHAMIDGALYWHGGTVLAWDGARARVATAGESARTIRVSLHGARARELLAIIRSHFAHIHASLNHPKVSERLPCRCTECRAKSLPFTFDYGQVRRLADKGKPTVTCMDSGQDVAIADLLDVILDPPRPRRGGAPFDPAATDDDGVEQPEDIPMPPPRRPADNSPWASGSFYLVALVALMGAAGFLVHHVGLMQAAFAFVVGMLGLIALAAFQLRHDRRLAEKGLLRLVDRVLGKIPAVDQFIRPDAAD